jgi:hypothetical protein
LLAAPEWGRLIIFLPVALLFAGDTATTTACDFAAACARFNVRPV